jgi:hypothetical protein
MQNKYLHIFLLFIIISASISCTKEVEIPKNIQPIDTNLYKYIFKENSYWIYRDENTFIEDSVFVLKIEKKNYKYKSATNGYNFESYIITYKNQNGQIYTEHIFNNQIRRNVDDANPAETGKLVFYNFINEGYEGERFENLQEVETIKYHTDGYGYRWTNAIRFYSSNSNTPDDGDYIIYTDEAGIIYYTENFINITNRKIKSLIRWQVEKI